MVEDPVAALCDLDAVVEDPEVERVELVAELGLLKVLVALPVRGDNVVALGLEPLGKVRRDEAAGADAQDLELLVCANTRRQQKKKMPPHMPQTPHTQAQQQQTHN